MMFNKKLLAIAVLACSTTTAFADNEAWILQSDASAASASGTAKIEQVYVDGQTVVGQIIQADTAGASAASVYQGVTDDVGAFDLSGGLEGLSKYSQDNGTSIDVTAASVLFGDISATLSQNAEASNVGLIKQSLTDASIALVLQAGADDLIDLGATPSALIDSTVLTNGSGLVDGKYTAVVDAALTLEIDPVTTVENNNNLGLISQGVAQITDRLGANLGAAATAAATEEAIIVQSGTNQVAVILQGGDGAAVTAAVFQDGSGNDAYVAQYAATDANSANIIQVATNDTATIYQAGGLNSATIYQH